MRTSFDAVAWGADPSRVRGRGRRIAALAALALTCGCDRGSTSAPAVTVASASASASASAAAAASASIAASASATLEQALDRTERELVEASASGSASAGDPIVVPAPSSRLTPPPWLLAMAFDPPRLDAESDLRSTRWKLRTCWRRLATDAPPKLAPIAIDLVLDEAGAVVKSAIAQDGGDRALTTCLLSALKTSTFTQADGASPKLRVTWTPKP